MKKINILDKIKNFQKNTNVKNNFFVFLTFIIYILIILVVSYYHECWEDESQCWLIARNLGFIDIIKQMKYEGHSFLWYYILAIFAKSGLSYEFSKIIMVIIAGITGFLILSKSPYNKLVKIMILFNSVFLYYMPAFLRPYALIPLMLICISIMNEKPEKYPICYGLAIASLANSHIIVLGLAFFIYFKFFMEQFIDKYEKNTKKQNIKLIIGTIIAISGMLIVMACAIAGFLNSIAPTHGTDIPEEILNRIVLLAERLHNCIIDINISTTIILFIDFIILLCIIFQTIKTDKNQGLIFGAGLIFYLFVQIMVFGIFTSQRTVLLYIFLLYFSWNTKKISMEKNKVDMIEIIILLICIIGVPHTIHVISDEITYPYTDSKNVAEYIKENIEEGSTFITVNWNTISAVQPYFVNNEYKFYDATSDTYMAYATWNRFLDNTNDMYIENSIEKFKNSNQKIYVLNFIPNNLDIMDIESFNKSKDKLKLLYSTKVKCFSKKAYLYEIIK